MQRVFKNILFSAIVFFIFLAFFEILFSIFWPSSSSPPLQEPFFGIEAALKKEYRSQILSSLGEYDHPVYANAKGLRGREFDYAKNDKEYRVLVLGDSQTFGTGASENELFSEHIETFINAKNFGYPENFTVINAGMPGTGTYDQLIYLESEGVKYKPDLVIIVFYINDYDDNVNKKYTFKSITYNKKKNELTTSGFQYYKYEEKFSRYLVRNVFNSIPFYGYLSTHSNLLIFLKQRIHNLIKKDYLNTKNELVLFLEKNNIANINWIDKEMNNKEHLSSKKGFAHLASVIITKSLMSRVSNFTDQHNMDFLLVIMPQKGEIINKIPKRKYLFMGQDTKIINTLNLTNYFANVEKNKLSYLFYPKDIHISPTGHLAAGYFISLHMMDLFFKNRQFDKDKIEKTFQQFMEQTRNHLIKRLNSIKDYPEIHFYKALALASENYKKISLK